MLPGAILQNNREGMDVTEERGESSAAFSHMLLLLEEALVCTYFATSNNISITCLAEIYVITYHNP